MQHWQHLSHLTQRMMVNDLRLALEARPTDGGPQSALLRAQSVLGLYEGLGVLRSTVSPGRAATEKNILAELVTWRSRSKVSRTRSDDDFEENLTATASAALSGVAQKAAEGSDSADEPESRPSVTRPSVARHIEEFFSKAQPGTWYSIAQIARYSSKEFPDRLSDVFGSDRPSYGAVTARIYAPGGCAVANVVACDGPGGKKGAVRVK